MIVEMVEIIESEMTSPGGEREFVHTAIIIIISACDASPQGEQKKVELNYSYDLEPSVQKQKYNKSNSCEKLL